ncbi:MAG TPA: FAD-dependent oxidoreductase [Burkholderiaceae bacterium]|nr:FAD-dependent oxidoreductase [Burkholderiaceae bacterium]
MTPYEATLTSKSDVAEGTTAFFFSKPDGFLFKPGQAIDVILPADGRDPQDADRHAFSIVSAPYQNELCITTRMRDSAFKGALKALPVGGRVQIDGPFGSLTLHNNVSRPAVFVAGGIGITPFMSILRHAEHEALPHELLLVYSNRRPEDAAFLQELQALEQRHPHFRLRATMTQMQASDLPWSGETGLMDDAMLRRALDGLSDPLVYLVGPPGMVEAMKATLERVGVDDDDIRTEEFYGY